MTETPIGPHAGEDFASIASAFVQADGPSVHDTWERLSAYWKERNWPDEARWCQLRAEGKSWQEAYDMAYGKVQTISKSDEPKMHSPHSRDLER